MHFMIVKALFIFCSSVVGVSGGYILCPSIGNKNDLGDIPLAQKVSDTTYDAMLSEEDNSGENNKDNPNWSTISAKNGEIKPIISILPADDEGNSPSYGNDQGRNPEPNLEKENNIEGVDKKVLNEDRVPVENKPSSAVPNEQPGARENSSTAETGDDFATSEVTRQSNEVRQVSVPDQSLNNIPKIPEEPNIKGLNITNPSDKSPNLGDKAGETTSDDKVKSSPETNSTENKSEPEKKDKEVNDPLKTATYLENANGIKDGEKVPSDDLPVPELQTRDPGNKTPSIKAPDKAPNTREIKTPDQGQKPKIPTVKKTSSKKPTAQSQQIARNLAMRLFSSGPSIFPGNGRGKQARTSRITDLYHTLRI